MTNEELSTQLRDLANLMVIAGEDEFKANRYARVAETVEALNESAAALLDAGTLTDLPGIGDSTAAVIAQIIETGTSDLHRSLLERVPATVLDLLAISGIGVKTAKRLYTELGVDSLDSLDEALRAGKLAKMKGMGAKTVDNIRAGIARIRRRNVERPLHEVLHIGEQIGDFLSTVPETTRIAHTGEARRGVELPKSAQIVATSADVGRACAALAKFGLGDGSLTRQVRGEFGGGFPIRIHLAPSREFGVTWLATTSDRDHLDALNARATERSLPPLVAESDAWHGLSEAAIYDRLGLPFIEPELREGTRAIEHADASALPKLMTQEDYLGDLHCHTSHSDGRHTIREMAEAAIARGYKYLAITDHSRSTVIANGLNEERLLRQIDEVRDVNESLAGRITLLAGSEVDILRDGSLDFHDGLLAQLDWVVASVHAAFTLPEKQQTERMCRAMENPYVRVVGHPTGRLLGERDPYAVDVDALIEKASATGVALELNASPERLDLNAVYLSRARDKGVRVSINTDAHRHETFAHIDYGLKTSRRAWLEPGDVVNAWQVEDVRKLRTSGL